MAVVRGSTAVHSGGDNNDGGAQWRFLPVKKEEALGRGYWPALTDHDHASSVAEKRLLLVRFPLLDGAAPTDLSRRFGAPAWVLKDVYSRLRWCGAVEEGEPDQ